MVLEIFHFIVRNLGQDGYRHFVGFQPHFYLDMTSQTQCCKTMKNENAISQESLSKNETKILQNGDVHLAQIPDFEMGYLESHLAH